MISYWLANYNKATLKDDLIASGIVVSLLIPQAMAYALVAGLPPMYGLYASMFPIMLYALLGGSSTLSIGPVAILAMMTFAFLSPIYPVGSIEYLHSACLLAVLTGIISFFLGVFRFGFLIQLISRPVIHSFIISASVLIALGQLRFILDIKLKADNLINFTESFYLNISNINWVTTSIGTISILCLIYIPKIIKKHLPKYQSYLKTLPLVLVAISIIIHQACQGLTFPVNIPSVGTIPSGLPALSIPHWTWQLVQQLLLPAFLIAMVNFVESISIAEATALQQRKNLNSNQELIAIGVSNLGAGLTMGFPVGGSLSRTVVNADAGAKTPISGFFVGVSIIIISLFFTHVFYYLPLSVLAGTIIFSIWRLIKIQPFIETWRYSKRDGIAMWITFLAVVFIDISTGLMIGVISTFILLLWKMSRPHIATIGLVSGTQHFRNIKRHQVLTCPKVCALRIDENLNFLNAHSLKQSMMQEVSQNNQLQHFILNCSSISDIDFSASEVLEEINHDLNKINIQLHLSEVKGPVMDQLQKSHFLTHLSGEIFLSHYQAVKTLSPTLMDKI